jgi:hypothetical protein
VDFLRQGAACVVLVLANLVIQCAGMAAVIDWGLTHFMRDARRLGPIRSATLIIRITSLMMCVQLVQVLVWAAFYRWTCFDSWPSSFYFSTTTYSTVGYGDVVLPDRWNSLGPIEALTGVLACGLSVSLLFAIVTRVVDREVRLAPELADLRKMIADPLDTSGVPFR